jgi:hypothetical protein
MGQERIRLTGKELFVYYFKKLGEKDNRIKVGGCTNKRILSKRTGISESLLMGIFTRKGFSYYENEDVVIMKLHTGDIEKGRQSITRRGRGGMESFVKYLSGKGRSDY